MYATWKLNRYLYLFYGTIMANVPKDSLGNIWQRMGLNWSKQMTHMGRSLPYSPRKRKKYCNIIYSDNKGVPYTAHIIFWIYTKQFWMELGVVLRNHRSGDVFLDYSSQIQTENSNLGRRWNCDCSTGETHLEVSNVMGVPLNHRMFIALPR